MTSQPRPKLKTSTIKRPTPETPFHIDYGWWEESGLDMKAYLYSRLPEHHDMSLDTDMDEVDLVDPRTGEVKRVDGFEYVMQTYFGQLSEDFVTRTPMAEAIFFILLANANQPMTLREIAERVQRSPDVILKTIGGPTVYNGIRPIYEE